MESLELAASEEALNNLTALIHSLRQEMSEIETLQGNVKKSIEMLDKYGASAIPQLNLDKGLEGLLGVPEDQITVEAAKESFTKLDAELTSKAETVALTLEANLQQLVSNEGFWRRLTYNFTTDFKCAARIDELVKKLNSLDAEGEKKLSEIKFDYGMQDKKVLQSMQQYADITMDWAKQNLPEIEKLLKEFFGKMKHGDGIRNSLYAMANRLANKLPEDGKTYENWVKNKTKNGGKLEKGKTLKELGYTKADVLAIIKDFKAKCSGSLATLKKLRSISDNLSAQTIGNVTTIYTWMYPVISFCDMAVSCYKYIDYFLYYISKEV